MSDETIKPLDVSKQIVLNYFGSVVISLVVIVQYL
jgi:hypothetical protein